MKHQLALIALVTLGAPSTQPAPAAEPLSVVATIPDLADIVREIGGDRVDVTAIARGKENLHQIVARPSHLVAMSRADLFFEIGLSLEMSFVPGLLENSRNARIQPGAPGFVNVSEGWEAIDVPVSLSRKAGDVHPQGNPHMNLDPRAGRFIADRVLAALSTADPGSRSGFEARHADYARRLEEAGARWSALGERWSDKRVVVYHQEYNYLARAYGIVIAGTIESKPGIPPTPGHVAELVATMKRDGVGVVLTAIWSNNREVERIAEKTGATVVELPNMCGGLPGAETWIGMMDLMHQRLQQAFDGSRAAK